MSLYLKYRPQNFNDVVGQDHVITTLQNAVKHKSLVHAYLFSGPRGTGKTSLARIIAKSINCTNLKRGIEPCNECIICRGVLDGRLVDLIEIDAASNRGIDEIRELKEKIAFAPNQAKSKVYIIDEVHMLTKEAFNALLKTLEEPPSHAYFILATTEAHKIPETIISRCQQFNFKRITRSVIITRLRQIAINEGVTFEDEALELIANSARGGMRDAIGFFEQMTIDGKIEYKKVAEQLGLSGPTQINRFYSDLLNHDSAKAIEVVANVNTEGQNLNQFMSEFISFLREQMLLGISNNKDVTEIIKLIEAFSVAKEQINKALIPQLPIEVAVIKACESKTKSEPKSEPIKEAEQAEEIIKTTKPKAVSDSTELPKVSLNSIKENWQRILNRIETPFIRMSLMDGEPTKFEAGSLHMSFKSDSFMKKVASANNQKEIHQAFNDVFGSKINLKLEMKKISLKPVTQKEDPKEVSVADMAKEVFGG